MDAQKFKETLKRFASGVTAITWRDEDNKIQGITVSAFSSLSLEPPLVLFCINKNAYIYSQININKLIAINILNKEQINLAYQFAGANRENLEDLIHENTGVPFIKNSHASLKAKVIETINGGDHTIFIAELLYSELNDNDPMIYHNGIFI